MSSALLVLIFAAGALATWGAGIVLAKTTYTLDRRLNIGAALGGLVLLAIAGSLPEVAITVSAAASGNLGLAAGNLIGGIATQTMVLVLCDLFAPKPLTFLVGSLIPVLEGLLVVLVLSAVLLGALLPSSLALEGVISPASIGIVVVWAAGVAVLNWVRKDPKWEVVMRGSRPGRPHHRMMPAIEPPQERFSTALVASLFVLACVITLAAGVALEITGNELADRAGINGVVFGATVLALATALPEISSGIEAVRLGDHQLAVGDIFGGNAFQVCLFLLADLVAAGPVLPRAGHLNSWLAALSIALTAIYAMGVVVRAERPARIGPDSLLAIVVFAVGIVGLVYLSP
jgi:cation:H+ antiporter